MTSESAAPTRRIDWDRAIPAAYALCAVIVALHLVSGLRQVWLDNADLASALLWTRPVRFRIASGGQMRNLVANGQIWRMWTASLLHGDALHLLVNLTALAALGRLLEPWIGALRFLSWFFAGALGGALLSHVSWIRQTDGASGGAFALLAATCVLGWRWRKDFDAEDRQLLGPLLTGFLLVNLVISFALPFINAAGHVGGLLVGLLLGATWRGPRPAGTALHAVWLAACVGVVAWGLGVRWWFWG